MRLTFNNIAFLPKNSFLLRIRVSIVGIWLVDFNNVIKILI
jgi:hypothetical protein